MPHVLSLNLSLPCHNRYIIDKEGCRHLRRCRLANEDQGHSLTDILGEYVGGIKCCLLPALLSVGVAGFLQLADRLAVAIQQ